VAKYEKKAVNLSKGARSVYEKSGELSCYGCFSKKLELEKLREENQQLKRKLKKLKQGDEVISIGAHTPSSQKPFKAKSSLENCAKRGGGVPGHPGKGRKSLKEESADKIVRVDAPQDCPDCGKMLLRHSSRKRSVLDAKELQVCKTLYEVERAKCGLCNKIYESKLPLFPKALYSNALLSKIAVMHYVHGVPITRACGMLGAEIGPSGILAALQRTAKRFEPALKGLIEDFRSSPVKHADETGWRTDGQPGWSWLFCTPKVSIFECSNSRSSKVPKQMFGNEPLPGVLVVDRYSAYNKLPCQIQYCFAHLLREVKKLDAEFSEDEQVATFTADMGHLLSEAMRLPSRTLSDLEYYATAKDIAGQIKTLTYKPSTHMGIRNIQSIFQSKEARLFQWVVNRDVPAHNNRAERELRQTVIARKVSFGSQSDAGAKTRSILMSILSTAKKQLSDQCSIENWFTSALDQLALNSQVDPFSLFQSNSS
jgi:transposase